ncbi:MAG: AbrB/MazE/SpoVT family DNA-binding domain-containing protein [Nitrososphaerales archaeon]
MRISARVRRIGNSLGIIIPKQEVHDEKIEEGDLVEVEVLRRTSLREMFGSVKFRKTAQELKDETRREWGE